MACWPGLVWLGGAYTYARVPLGFEIQHWFGLHRNPYDKIGHFMQGFVPALVCREVLLTTGAVKGRKMAAFLSICVAVLTMTRLQDRSIQKSA